MSGTAVLIAGLVFVGTMLILWKNKRCFGRVGPLGVERFRSYRHKLCASFFDTMLLGCGLGMLGAAGLIYLVEYEQGYFSVVLLLLFAWLIEDQCYKSKK
jgi:hypothetical protein